MSQQRIAHELKRTNPDYVVYVPGSMDGSTHDTGNEHFLVFDGPDDSLMAVWTQSTREGMPNQRIAFARSDDKGHTWSKPKIIAGPTPSAEGRMASWGFPMVSKTGRIYVVFSQHIGFNDYGQHTTGWMHGIYSDDGGKSWSSPQKIPMRHSKWDNPDTTIPANWIVWQKPLRLSEGNYFNGMTRWVSPTSRLAPSPGQSWIQDESVVEFMRWENLDDNPEPKDLIINARAGDDEALRVSYPGIALLSIAQEPSVVPLPDKRLFCAMRTATGNPYYTLSDDAGMSWAQPQPLRFEDDSLPMRHPLSPCPIYDIGDGRYVFLFHNHDGHFGKWGPFDTGRHRRPIYLCLGEYRAQAKQPIWFSEPKILFDSDGVSIGYQEGRTDMAMYSSLTLVDGQPVLWYPDRKFFLLGKRITSDFLADLSVSEK